MTAWLLCLGVCCAGAGQAPPDPAALAERIDRHLQASFQRQEIVPAPVADDAEFFRRVSLDLIGRIPAAADVRKFLADSSSSKRESTVDGLLRDPRHAEHFARSWRALLLPEAETDFQVDYFRPGLEAWLRERREKNVGFDRMVRDLIAVPIAANKTSPEMVLLDLRRPNVLGFFAAKEAKPENLAASTTRLFLGIRLECAQCHNHPFGHWTQTQFWNQAAFFAGLERQGKGVFSPLLEQAGRREIPVLQTTKLAPAVFLDGKSPSEGDDAIRAQFADWITSAENSQFSKATVNRIWGQLMGVGLVEPVDDFQDSNPASHPALLDELATAFVDSGFDLTYLMGAICRTEAYQRTSRLTHPSQEDPRSFARMEVKQLSGEQFLESVLAALGYPREADPLRVGRNRDPLERQLLEIFATSEKHNEPQTSILQALILMNGRLINDAVAQPKSPTLVAVMERGDDPLDSRVESLYLATLSRSPSQAERKRVADHLAQGSNDEALRRMGDVLWMLLNSMEFRCNH